MESDSSSSIKAAINGLIVSSLNTTLSLEFDNRCVIKCTRGATDSRDVSVLPTQGPTELTAFKGVGVLGFYGSQ